LPQEILTSSEEETERFGGRLAERLSAQDVVYLVGDLGTGKTALARGVARGLGALKGQVASPTFAILHEYADRGGAIVLRHLDLYRLEDHETELAVLGLPDSVEGAPVVVEWPGAAIRQLLPPTLELELKVLPDERREIRILAGAGDSEVS
jgi:tRNA threonylcarbamoyladenosine biosynthesis protein TsaE